MPYLSTASQLAFNLAAWEAQALSSKYVDTEHLFLGLCKIEDILKLDKSPIAELDEKEWQVAIKDINEFNNLLTAKGFDPKNARRLTRKLLKESMTDPGVFSGHRTQRCRNVFALAEGILTDFEKTMVVISLNLKYLMAAILCSPSTCLDTLFVEININRNDLLKCFGISDEYVKLVRQKTYYNIPIEEADNKNQNQHKSSIVTSTPLLAKFSRDVTQLAKEGKLNPTIGREKEIIRIAQILMQQKKNNPILVGDAGVGKTAVVEGFATKIVQDNAPKQIRNYKIFELNMGSLVAGTKYRGEFEERLEGIIKEAASNPNIILFIDEMHTVIGAGAAGGSLDAGNILKPALARGTIKCIGATTTAEYRKYIEKDAALERRFQLIWIDEPTKAEAVQILTGLKKRFEEHHRIIIPDDVVEKTIELSMRYLPDFHLPDKALDILDQACARFMLKTFSPIINENSGKTIDQLGIEDVARVVSDRCRIPIESLTTEDKDRLLNIEDHLKKRVMGQDYAVREISKAIKAAKTGLKDPNKPLVFLFAGSTGTGKTELAKALADFLFYDEKHLITFDMTEYQEKHSIAKLIGSPPGYIGYDEEGQLTGKIRTNPYSVILFDEIEKAHPDIFDIFLQIFDEGRLTDAHGRRVNFSESIIILTSNLGNNLASRKIGFGVDKSNSEKKEIVEGSSSEDIDTNWKKYEAQIHNAIDNTFKPEFLNRIQKTIIFYPLTKETLKKIISEKIIASLNNRLTPKNIQVILSDDAFNYLIDKGYDETFGARGMQRTFDKYVSEPLSQIILNGGVKPGQRVSVTVNIKGLQLDVE